MSETSAHGPVRRSYDTVSEEYRRRIGDELAHKPLDRALLAALIEQTEPGTPIADLGCGPGHIAGWLAEQGARPVGVDLSPAMVGIARREHPKLEFREGDLLHLPAADGEFGAAIALYSVIHLAPAELRPAFTEIHRTLRPGGLLLLAFHLGTEVRHLTEWWDHPVDVDFHFLDLTTVEESLTSTGFTVEARLERTNYPQEAETRRGYLLARRDRP
ncbi:SAM-dependent methyltransferase [Kitasatospora gansuensis]|uniref:SAM-dependent methyltransferase n=1 Tax=Kitasatospora gansuensis TaxID=258050 RepID=A0A7W7S6D4_9ACTN|nr:class I SAM-dependent methyltransferase [Kitasatospora gansuensis]MBB4944740.1 SAM-dependent methyltransferase [Kitasatospora gansuensis]